MGRWCRLRGVWLAAGLATALLPAAAAQVGRGVVINRPSAYGPSILINRVGGRYTRQRTPASFRPRAVARAPGAVTLPTRSPYGGFPAPATRREPAYRPTYIRNLIYTGELLEGHLRNSSGFTRGTRVDTPLTGWGWASDKPPATRVPEIEPRGYFQEFFDLVATHQPPEDAEPLEFADLTAAVEARTQGKVGRMMDDARRLFKEVTRGTAKPLEPAVRYKKLRRIVIHLTGIRDLDREAYVPSLLLAHVALDRQQIATALNGLISVARRRPEVFREIGAGPDHSEEADDKQPSVASHFGDYDERTGRSPYLDKQMRAYVRPLSTMPTIDGLVLEAYCAWVLGDDERAHQALDRTREVVREDAPASPYVDRLIVALRYALAKDVAER